MESVPPNPTANGNVRHVKLCLIGNSGVGKTCMAARLIYNTYNPKLTKPSIGIAYGTKDIPVDGVIYRIHIWDTAGQERFESMVPIYYRNATAILVTYDISEQDSFLSLRNWIKEVSMHTSADIILIIAGNKCDLVDERRVERRVAKKYAEEMGARFFETSARTNTNIQEMFKEIAEAIHQQATFQYHNETTSEDNTSKKKCAC